MNYRAKFVAASFIIAGEIRNRTNKKQTITDIPTPCLSARVDNKMAALGFNQRLQPPCW